MFVENEQLHQYFSLPTATDLKILDTFLPFSRPAFSAINGYGSRTWASLNSLCFSAKISQQIPSLDPI